MRIINIFIAIGTLAIASFAYAADISKIFSPSPETKAIVEINGVHLNWKVYNGSKIEQREIDLDTEKSATIKVASYDFSGQVGFSVSYMDDGMGVYEINRVFTFSRTTNKFVERFPVCGDRFVNLRMDKKRRRLISTYWVEGAPKICTTYLMIEK